MLHLLVEAALWIFSEEKEYIKQMIHSPFSKASTEKPKIYSADE